MDFRMNLLVLGMVLLSGCLGGSTPETPTTSLETTTVFSTSSLPETTVPTTSSLPTTLPTTTSLTTTTVNPKSCENFCELRGYEAGNCRRGRNECTLNYEVYDRTGSRYCFDQKDDTCCCTNDPEKEDVVIHYKYYIGSCYGPGSSCRD
ncbi:MAG: hypothetical protein ABH950_09360 [Candidatus Altiarchaeota archaeon]